LRFWRRDGAGLILSVKLTPHSDRDRLGDVWTDAAGAVWLRAQVRAVPEKGKANAALVALLAKLLKIPKAKISLEAGDTNRLKRLRIDGADDALVARLTQLTHPNVTDMQ
jgi:uncharacterized protein YggU (UPF0235/DUF167 family)